MAGWLMPRLSSARYPLSTHSSRSYFDLPPPKEDLASRMRAPLVYLGQGVPGDMMREWGHKVGRKVSKCRWMSRSLLGDGA